jgi:hypothetical protein
MSGGDQSPASGGSGRPRSSLSGAVVVVTRIRLQPRLACGEVIPLLQGPASLARSDRGPRKTEPAFRTPRAGREHQVSAP